MEKQIYKKVLEENDIKRPVIKNALFAFLSGGLICLFGESIRNVCINLFGATDIVANFIMYLIVILSASLLTGFGLFDKIGQISGAGTIVPITGFANSVTSAALESKSEGIIEGIMVNMFKLAGAVIVAGVVSAFIVSFVLYMVG